MDDRVADLLKLIKVDFKNKPFVPHRIFRQGDVQTLAVYLWPGRFRSRERTTDEERLFQVEPGSQVLARCRWQPERAEHPTLIVWPGIEGSTAAFYKLRTPAQTFLRG